jgi:hypothetical protein
MFGRRKISQLAIALDEPECRRDDADANRRIASLKALQSGHRNPHAACPGFQGFFAPQAGHSQVGTKLFDGGSRRRRELQ